MKKEEKMLFKELCSFKSETFNEDLLKHATPSVLGHLFFNRMQAVAFGRLSEAEKLGAINREFRNSLMSAYEHNKAKNESFNHCLKQLTEVLSGVGWKYALLKGASLCSLYPGGYRTSNDIDVLILPDAVTDVGNALLDAGFRQGYIRNGIFIPATRKQIIEAKMTRGETVPYIKEVFYPEMKYLEVDLNFSVDYKNGDPNILHKMLNRTVKKQIDDFEIRTLNNEDFFIHLCCHLHKEATTYPWVEMRRDMSLYKYADIYMLLSDMRPQEVLSVFARASELGLEKICAFAVIQTDMLFDVDNSHAVYISKTVLANNPDFIHTVIDPKTKRTWIYREKDVFERLFCENRIELLEEVSS